MATKKKPEPTILTRDGSEIVRRFRTEYWFDGRLRAPSPWSRGFPQAENGSTRGASQLIMTGVAIKAKCFDRVTGKYLWTIKRGERVPGTHVYQPIITPGDLDAA